MQRIKLDTAAPDVKKALRSLSSRPNGVEVELDGAVIGRLLPEASLSDAEKTALVTRGRELVRRARQRNKEVPSRLLQQEVDQAVQEVRRRRP
jgi:hypothetical protein